MRDPSIKIRIRDWIETSRTSFTTRFELDVGSARADISNPGSASYALFIVQSHFPLFIERISTRLCRCWWDCCCMATPLVFCFIILHQQDHPLLCFTRLNWIRQAFCPQETLRSLDSNKTDFGRTHHDRPEQQQNRNEQWK